MNILEYINNEKKVTAAIRDMWLAMINIYIECDSICYSGVTNKCPYFADEFDSVLYNILNKAKSSLGKEDKDCIKEWQEHQDRDSLESIEDWGKIDTAAIRYLYKNYFLRFTDTLLKNVANNKLRIFRSLQFARQSLYTVEEQINRIFQNTHNKVGIYWTLDRKRAEPYFSKVMGYKETIKIQLTGEIDVRDENISCLATINNSVNLYNEKEIFLKPDSEIILVSYKYGVTKNKNTSTLLFDAPDYKVVKCRPGTKIYT